MVLLSLLKFDIKKILKNDRYKKLIFWLQNPSWFITGILAGNNIANVSFSTIYSLYILDKFDALNINPLILNIFIFITASSVVLFFGEIAPKNLGRSKARKLIFYIYKPLVILMYILSPAIFLFRFFENIFLKDKKKHNPKFTIDDMHNFVDFIEQSGVIEESAEDMIHSYLDLRTRKVAEIMIPIDKMETIDIDTEKNIFAKAQAIGRSRIPVYKGDINNIVGLLYAKDLAGYIFKDNFDIHLLLRTPIFLDSNETLKYAFKIFKKNRKHIALVKEDNNVVGLLTMEDILEEVVGDIFDEYDVKRKK
jgi:putative hemolysin